MRHIASMDEVLNDSMKLKAKVEKLMSGVFHAYMIGQVHLNDFDAQLETDPSGAMKSDAYGQLLAVRTFVDKFEHDLNDLYLGMVLASVLPEYGPEQKLNAEIGLNAIGNFMRGIKTDTKKLPENLRPLILSNLREKQAALYEELKVFQDEQQDEDVKSALQKHMVSLRATKTAYFNDMKNYRVDPVLLRDTLKEEMMKKSFVELQADINKLAKEMKSLISEFGRGTSSDAITPSAGPNGNISGRTFPKGTWSLTYDDGPGKSTTEQVLNNLTERKIPATFFMLAKQVEAYPQTALKLKTAGMDLASHSYTHAQLTKVGSVQLEREIGTSKKVMEEKLDTKIKLFRLPYGAGVSVSNVRAKIAEHGMIHVFWTVDTLDWQDKNPQSIMNRTLKQMQASAKNSGIILFHDIHSQSVTASTMLMDYMNKQNLTVCTVQGVVNQLNENLPSCK
jgi:peptidoglycan/xylan/chitin deacetylase (PgdA/CDA1 family)